MTKPDILASLLAVVVNAQEAQIKSPRKTICARLCSELSAEGWVSQKIQAFGDNEFEHIKSRVAVELQTPDYDLIFKKIVFLRAAYEAHFIDAGVIILITSRGKKRIKEPAAHYERLCEDLKILRPTIIVPLWIIGLN